MVKSFYDPKVEERGIEKGLEKGAILARREDILENFNEIGAVTDEITKIVNKQNDIQTLKKWLKISSIVENLEEFINKIK
jgi:hypothetical protein